MQSWGVSHTPKLYAPASCKCAVEPISANGLLGPSDEAKQCGSDQPRPSRDQRSRTGRQLPSQYPRSSPYDWRGGLGSEPHRWPCRSHVRRAARGCSTPCELVPSWPIARTRRQRRGSLGTANRAGTWLSDQMVTGRNT